MADAQAKPPTPPRHIIIDALRGFAVMGILALNITAFSMPEMAYLDPAIYGGDHGANLVSWFFSYIFVDGKMRGIFSLLFGASMMLVIERADAAGRGAGKTHYMRMLWLALFGLAHYFFIWFGDILFLYAVIGSIAFAYRKWDPSRLIRSALAIHIAGSLILSAVFGGLLYLRHEAQSADASPEIVAQYEQFENGSPFTAESIAKEISVYRGNYAEILDYRLTEKAAGPVMQLLMVFTETLPLMMIGMALFKSGFLLGQWDRRSYWRWAIYATMAGLFLHVAAAFIQYDSGFDIALILNTQIAWMMVPRTLMTIGYVSALILIIGQMSNSRFLERVAAAGRMAFTNYLGTSIVMTGIFYGYGLGLYGHLERAMLWPFVIGAWAVMLYCSQPWLDRFYYGPLEWLWRSLARMQLQKFRRQIS